MNANRNRFELARQNFSRALFRLHEAVDFDESDMARDALIQRFEFTYELAWKSLFYGLRDAGENVQEMVRPVFQAAFRAQWIGDPQVWERIKDCRDETSHTYNEAKAIAVAAFVRAEALATFDALRGKLAAL